MGQKENLMNFSRSPRPRQTRERVLAIEAGQVVCPRRGIVDLESCWICPAYRGLTTGHTEGLICGTEPVFLPMAARWPAAQLGTDDRWDR